MKRLMRAAVVLALVIASSSAAALGLGQIQLKSKLGEPLLAEIPIVSSDPSELENLRAGLASPETFARIGLQRPQGVVAGLQFVPALDSAGRPVIRVTSAVPIDEPLLTFLVEVDWGQGRLVREYSTLLDAPRTLATAAQPQIQAPQQAASNTILRDPVAGDVNGAGFERAGDNTAEPAAVARGREPADRVGNEGSPAASPPAQYGAVQRGEHLSTIAAGLDMAGNLEQRMIALLQANPQAFIDGNVHLLKQGAVLRVPDADEVAGIAAARAAAQVREQTRAWRVASQPVPQPEVAGSAPEGAQTSATAAVVPATSAGSDGARLEIVPPGANDASRAGTQSGISAGGEGDMVRQQLQVTKETLAARDAELAELKSRIDTLEELQADQQKLLSMKDSDLAAAQQQLAQSQSDASPAALSATPWLLGGTALVLVLLGAWWIRRRATTGPRFRAPVAPDGRGLDLVAGFPAIPPASAAATDASVLNPESMHGVAAVHVDAAHVDHAASPQADAAPAGTAVRPEPPGAALPAVPAWHAGSDKQRLNRPTPKVAADVVQPGTPAAETSRTALPPSSDRSPVNDADAPGMDRLELARAYLDLGDQDSARQLLGELVVTGGLEARQQATRLLREIG